MKNKGGPRPSATPDTGRRRRFGIRQPRGHIPVDGIALQRPHQQMPPAGVERQLRVRRDYAGREGWAVAAIFGTSKILRPGIRTLLNDAPCGKFGVVLAEALDCISRDQADVACQSA